MKKTKKSKRARVLGKLLIHGLLIFFAFQTFSAQTPDAKTLSARVEKFVAPYLEMQDFSGAILISQNGRILFEKGFGFSDFEARRPNTPATRFRIGSLNKQLTAATVLLLEEKGKLKTSDPVSKFFPDFPNGDAITLQHLLTHRSGLPKYVPYKDQTREPTSDELVKIIGALTPEAKPGERYNYSNAGFVLLALVVEKVSGQSFPRFLTENVFKPLKMKSSGVAFGIDRELAKGYVTGVGKEIVPAPSLGVFNYQVFSTARDLDRWQNGLYGGRLLRAESLAKMTNDYGDRYGYGLSVGKSTPRYFGHDGIYSGYTGFVTYFPDEKLSLVYLGNIESGALGELQTNLPQIAFGKEAAAARVREFPRAAPAADYPQFAGRYEVFPGFHLDVKYADGVLSLRGPMGAFIALTPLGTNEFFYRHLYAKVTFVRGEDGKIARLDWSDASGSTYPCRKISAEPVLTENFSRPGETIAASTAFIGK